jgi:hypothetical protein
MALQSLYTFVQPRTQGSPFVSRAEIPTTFGPKIRSQFPHAIQKNTKICKLCKAIFSAFYNISQSNFAISLILVCSF